MPVALRAPLLPPLKEPVAVVLGEVLVDEPGPAGVDVLLMVEPRPVVVRERGPPEIEELVLEVEEEDEEELEEMN